MYGLPLLGSPSLVSFLVIIRIQLELQIKGIPFSIIRLLAHLSTFYMFFGAFF